MPQRDDLKDKFYTEAGRTGPKNTQLRQLNRDKAMSGVSGYPSDKDYMKLVGEAGIEKQQAQMKDAGDAEAARESGKHKIPSYKKGGRVRKTGLALVHKGEKVVPAKNMKRKKG